MSAALFENLLPRSSAACLFIAVIAAGVGLSLGGPVNKADAKAGLTIQEGSWSAQDNWNKPLREESIFVAQSKSIGPSLINGQVTFSIKGGVQKSNKLPFQGEATLELEVTENYEEGAKNKRTNVRGTLLRAKPEQMLKNRSFSTGETSAFSMFEIQFNRQGKAWGYSDGHGRWQDVPSGYALTPHSLMIALRQKPVVDAQNLTIYYPIIKDGTMLTIHNARLAKVRTAEIKLYKSTESVLCDQYDLSIESQIVDRYWIEQGEQRRIVQRKTGDGRTWLLKSHTWVKN